MKNNKYRVEKDSMGSMKVPVDALYGSQTQRAVENFPISNTRFFIDFINSIIIIKRSASIVNCKLGLLDKEISDSIVNE
jgi:fumarate hydratase class II